ncbi:MAG: cell division FtsZ family protein [Verrucomicrobia bacterium]|nr:cell division FtsZ family protein [Verrucomicrobiota bacterium]
MQTDPPTPMPPPANARALCVKIFGVGDAGSAMLHRMNETDFAGATLVAVNTEAAAFGTPAGAAQILLETKLLRGLGTGGDPERGAKAAEENFQTLKETCAGAAVVLILAGLGGGAGTGICPVLARAARESGALTLAFVTLPFDLEGNRRQQQARQGLEHLGAAADGVICLPNQKVCKLLDDNTTLLDAFRTTTQLLVEGARGVWRLLTHRGLIEIHLDELSALLRDRRGESCFAAVEAAGTTRARDSLEKLLAHPLLDGGQTLKEADAVLVSLLGGPELTMADVNRVMEAVNQQCQKAQVLMGAAVDENFRDRLAVTVIATRHGRAPVVAPVTETEPATVTASSEAPDLEEQLLEKEPPPRPTSRFVPPAPTLTPEQREQLLSKQGGRARKQAPRLRQGSLPLEIVNKGRFDKTEPTVHKGEDLDVPTYIRRGVALN